MAAKYQLMIDPTPAGWAYGFPKALPEHAVHGKGADLFIRKNFDLTEWVVEQGYPEESFQYFKTYVQKIEEEYVYPGGDCQE